MKICLTTPNRFGQNGGLKLINDFFKQLLLRGHDVYLMDENAVKCVERILTPQVFSRRKFDLVICCSPHSVWTLHGRNFDRSIVWAQMAEHLWSKHRVFTERCTRWYKHENIIVNSNWLLEFMPQAKVCRTWLQDDFEWKPQRIKYDILLESPFSNNPTKDVNHLAFKAAQHLQQLYRRIRVAGYGKKHYASSTWGTAINNYIVQPKHSTLENLYSQSRLLLKATKFDGAACALIEAARYGCVSVRAIDKGDDHFTNEWGYRCKYNEDEFFYMAEQAYESSLNDSLEFRFKTQQMKMFIDFWTFDKFIEEFSIHANISELYHTETKSLI